MVTLKEFFTSKLVLTLVALVRSKRLIRAIKFIPNSRIKSSLILIFDPNVLRRKTQFRLKENLVAFKLPETGSYIVNVNEHLGYRFFIEEKFDETVLEISKIINIQEDDILLDIGANIGVVSIPVALKFKAEVIAVEASPLNSSLLLKNISLNNVKFQVHNFCAVSPEMVEKEKYLKVYSNTGNSAANSIYKNWNRSKIDSQNFEYSRASTIDSILFEKDLERIKLIKIDVEGAELESLKGFSKVNVLDAPIVFEYRIDVMKRDLNDDGSKLVDYLSRHFELFGIKKNEKSGLKLVPFDPDLAVADAIGLPLKSLNRYLKLFKFGN